MPKYFTFSSINDIIKFNTNKFTLVIKIIKSENYEIYLYYFLSVKL